MPEGHTLHRLAADHRERFAGEPVAVSSPQGRFSDAARLLDGTVLTTAEAHGKHLFLGFGPDAWVHVHLGLYGKVTTGEGEPPEPVGLVRMRLAGPRGWSDLRGPTRCALVDDAGKAAVHARLGPDPLRPEDGPDEALRRIARSRRPIAALLMDQRVIAGVGNVYRAEALFRHGVDPRTPGTAVDALTGKALWQDLVELMAEGVRRGRIDTVRPEHEPEAMGRPPRVDDHGGEVYVYRRAGLPCLLCGTPVAVAELEARNLFWCPTCQPAG